MSAALLAWARATLTRCQTSGATPAFSRSACYVSAAAAKQQKPASKQPIWHPAQFGRHNYSSQAGTSRQSAGRLYLGYALGSAAGLGGVAVYLQSKAGWSYVHFDSASQKNIDVCHLLIMSTWKVSFLSRCGIPSFRTLQWYACHRLLPVPVQKHSTPMQTCCGQNAWCCAMLRLVFWLMPASHDCQLQLQLGSQLQHNITFLFNRLTMDSCACR